MHLGIRTISSAHILPVGGRHARRLMEAWADDAFHFLRFPPGFV